MWRPLIALVLAGALSSLIATIILSFIVGGLGSIDFALATMLFSVPGALMLRGLEAILEEHGFPRPAIAALVILAGGVAGGATLLFIFSRALESVMIGALYGSLTGAALLVIERVRVNPSAAR